MNSINFSRDIPIKYEVDVLVAGGGPAGVAAAIAAARSGMRVFVAESHGFFGGAATAALVPAFMPFENGKDFLAGGIGREIYDECIRHGFFVNNRTVGIHPEKYKRIMDKLVRAEPNIAFSFFTSLIGVESGAGRVEHCVFAAKSGIFAIKAKIYIDATGDGDLCVWAGAGFEMGDDRNGSGSGSNVSATGSGSGSGGAIANGSGGGSGNAIDIATATTTTVMPSTLCSLWTDIDWGAVRGSDDRELERALADGVFTQEDRHLPGMWRTGDRTGGGNIGHSFGVDSTDEVSLTGGMLVGRDIIGEYENYYRNYLGGGYKDAQVAYTAPYLGVRESRRIIGDYVMNVGDFNARARFDDEIGCFSYPVDIHIANPSKEAFDAFHKEHTTMRYSDGEFYGIPYRILLPKGLSNVYITGRSVSTDRQMQSSIRVMPSCFLTGQAAGFAAALAITGGADATRDVNIADLRAKLKATGLFLPEK
ncbi:MAG: FAD-dependent oxidoreductase [Oscillospiraceae bacterium]|nr:FAD-dependent oxidoreductase [Oscillospiraceae bacterium]